MSTIPDYNTNPGGFVGWLDGQSLDQLPGNKNPKLAELLALLDGKITLSAFRTGDAEALESAGAASVLRPYSDAAETAVRRLLGEIRGY